MSVKMSQEVPFNDILLPGKTPSGLSAFKFMSRPWNPTKSYVLDKCYSPQDLKDLVAKSVYLDSVIEAESARTGVRKEKLRREMLAYLEEMGLDKKIYVIRWMGIVFLKFCSMMKVGVFVNEPAILKLKLSMGANPVLFLPTHRSYADFCLMTYLCYNYDIDFPAVAAGMDFYSMAVVGRRMRETCAFYIRRTLAGAPLYAATLRQYVRTLVSKHCAPIEFFLEGTRSRSNKSLPPKYGMLSMALAAYFAHEVSDVTIVPVNISYDRLMETALFAYEHLGVPKPKESTGGLLKALHSLNDHFGNIYINPGAPLSVKQYLKSESISSEMLKPVDLQQLTPEQFTQVQDIANYVITLQQQNTVATISNLIALVLMQSLIQNKTLDIEDIVSEMNWVIELLKSLGASVYEKDVRSDVERILVVHSKMMRLDKDKKLRLLSSTLMTVSDDVKKKMKGHILKAETMVNAVPIIQLQLYVNPVLHYLVPPALLALLAQNNPSKERLFADYQHIRKLLRHEFFHVEKEEEKIFNSALQYCIDNNVIASREGSLVPGEGHKTRYLLKWSVWPALTTLLKCTEVMTEHKSCEHKKALKLVQERVESSNCHPYCLSLESIGNCLQGLALAGALVRDRGQQEVTYAVVPDAMAQSHRLVTSVLPDFYVDFGRNNSVILDHRPLMSRL
ncbi:dihydroxyacetone phosphate acyltransferase [Pectinophora gossypiella]|uniref:dihydroxyacetone phosphate acyltransferase n=1 Tax=Pectinophora gossypiella TaxID=13191 RepID=UPI00214E5ECB|nr:dihydroxyacetone phosphate acyltransferase [Pectinophora gossypiella]